MLSYLCIVYSKNGQCSNVTSDGLEFSDEFVYVTSDNKDRSKIRSSFRLKTGFYRVGYSLNGIFIGNAEIYLKEESQLLISACLSADIIKQLKIKDEYLSKDAKELVLESIAKDKPLSGVSNFQKTKCLNISQIVDGSSANYDESQLMVNLNVPQAYIKVEDEYIPNEYWSQGSTAGILSYNYSSYESTGVYAKNQYLGIKTKINAGTWAYEQTGYISSAFDKSTGYQIIGSTLLLICRV